LLLKAHFLSNIGLLSEIAAGPLEMDFREITSEDDHDTIVTKGNLSRKNGRAFQSNYNFLFQLRDGKIASGKEFLDAIHVTEIFGAP
jgi:ketosteroid isomerase-like protein